MSIEEESTSWALSVVDALESPENNNVRLAAAAGAAVITIIMWVTHLIYPDIFLFFPRAKRLGQTLLWSRPCSTFRTRLCRRLLHLSASY